MNAVPAKHLYLYSSRITSPSGTTIDYFVLFSKQNPKTRSRINAETTYIGKMSSSSVRFDSIATSPVYLLLMFRSALALSLSRFSQYGNRIGNFREISIEKSIDIRSNANVWNENLHEKNPSHWKSFNQDKNIENILDSADQQNSAELN